MKANRILGWIILIIGLALCGKGLAILFCPTRYEAVVRIEINPDYIPNEPTPYDPYFMETEFKRMEGGIVLSNVVQTLNLDVKWGREEGRQLGVGETIELLRQCMDIDAIQNTKIVKIGVWDREPEEAAQIANAIAKAYNDYRIDLHRQQMESGIEKLEEEWQIEETNILLMQSNVDQLRKSLGIDDTDTETPTSLTLEQRQHLNELLIEGQAACIRLQNQYNEFRQIQATNPIALADVLTTVNSDAVLSDLLGKLHENDQQFAVQTNYLGANNSDLKAAKASEAILERQIKDQVAGMMIGLEASLKAQRNEVLTLSNKLQSIESNPQGKVVRGQPYWEAKHQLDYKDEFHALLKQKIQLDRKYVIQPAATLVTIVEPAVAPKVPAVPNRWLGGVWLICGLAVAGLGICMLRRGVIIEDNKPREQN